MKKYTSPLYYLPVLLFAIAFILLACPFDHSEKENSTDIRYLNTLDAKIAYKETGDGDPLVMCIGYSANMDFWPPRLIQLLKEKYRVILFDYRGMGLSSNTDTLFTINTLADDVNELCKHLRISKTHIMGWSMGGYVAQAFAISHPEKVGKLILYSTDCGDNITVNAEQKIIDILSDSSATPAQLIQTLFPDRWTTSHPEPWKLLPDIKEPLNHTTINLQDRAISYWLSPGGGSAGSLYTLKMPTLIMSGNEDAVVPFKNSEILSDSISNATLVRINGGGHGMMYQYPALMAGYILHFLDYRGD
jgi:pimeloyl-ACP methyl ester carboxylesterase